MKGVQPVVRKPASVSLIVALTLLTNTAVPANAAFETICEIRRQCIEDVCEDVEKKRPRPVVVITEDGRQDIIEVGDYGDISPAFQGFAPRVEFRLPHPRAAKEAGALIYRFKTTDGHPGLLRIGPQSQSGSARPSPERPFDYSRVATVKGAAKKVVSSGICFDADHLVLGPGMVAGVVRADAMERSFKDPARRKDLFAHCKFTSPDDPESKSDIWLAREDGLYPDMACWTPPGSDAMACLDRQPGKARGHFESEWTTIDINPDGTASKADRQEISPMSATPHDVTKVSQGTCEIGPAY